MKTTWIKAMVKTGLMEGLNDNHTAKDRLGLSYGKKLNQIEPM